MARAHSTSKLDLRKTPTTSDPLPASTSQFSLVGGATAPPPLEKQSSGSLLGGSDDGTILRKSSKEASNDHSAHVTFDGLGTQWWVEMLGYDDFPAELSDLIQNTASVFEDTYSRFHDETLIGQLNIHKRLSNPPQELLDMFAFARKMHRATDGAFDISVGGTLQRLGYGDTNTAQAATPYFWDTMICNRGEIVIPRDSAVDLGGFGKGWLLDKLAVLLEKRGFAHYLINGGGDIILSAAEPIELGLEHPYEPTKVIGTTKITRGAMAVSSTVKRRWTIGGETQHHIIEPLKDAATDSPVLTAYVRGKTALIADTLATVLLLRPELKARLEEQFGIEAILVTADQLK